MSTLAVVSLGQWTVVCGTLSYLRPALEWRWQWRVWRGIWQKKRGWSSCKRQPSWGSSGTQTSLEWLVSSPPQIRWDVYPLLEDWSVWRQANITDLNLFLFALKLTIVCELMQKGDLRCFLLSLRPCMHACVFYKWWSSSWFSMPMYKGQSMYLLCFVCKSMFERSSALYKYSDVWSATTYGAGSNRFDSTLHSRSHDTIRKSCL